MQYGIYGLSLTNIYNFVEVGITMKPILILLFAVVAATTTLLTTTPTQLQAQDTPGNSGNGGPDNPQPDRVGNPDDDDGTVKDRDGPDDDDDDPDGKESNCWGEATRDFAHDGDGNGQSGIGDHASSFREPRQGVGNQAEDHPSDHADTVGDDISDADCIDRD